jgi:hypothetical protein
VCPGECDEGLLAKILGPLYRRDYTCSDPSSTGLPKRGDMPLCNSPAIMFFFVFVAGAAHRRRRGTRVREI